jgi:hypothetical protein
MTKKEEEKTGKNTVIVNVTDKNHLLYNFGRKIILPFKLGAITLRCASGASFKSNTAATTGLSVP